MMTNEQFLIQLNNTNHGEILYFDNDGIPMPVSVNENGEKTYKFGSYGGQEWYNIYYIKFDKEGNFISIEHNEAESFC